jgi:chromosome partitioning protein
VLNRCAARTVIARETRLALMGHEPAALAARIGQRVAFADAARTGRLVCDLRPHGIAAREIAALTAEIGGWCHDPPDRRQRAPDALARPYDMILVDPPYGDTSLAWDRRVADWPGKALAALKPSGSLWVFGSLRSFRIQRGISECGLEICSGTGLGEAERFQLPCRSLPPRA